MRAGPPSHVLAQSVSWRARVSSWRGTSLLAAQVPVSAGYLEVSATRQVPERLVLSVPPVSDGTSWVPDSPAHPLARFGQRLRAQIEVTAPGVGSWLVPVAAAAIQSSTAPDPGDVRVTAFGVLQVAVDDRLPSPTSPRPGGTFASEFRRLTPAGIPVQIDTDLIDRPCPRSFVWESERIDALYALADAWPAQVRMSATGGVRLSAPIPSVMPAPVLTWTDGEGGTLVSAPREDTRADSYNAVVARGVSDDPAVAPVQGEARVLAGPMAATGPYGVVRRFYASPLLTTITQCRSAAQTILERVSRPARTVTVTCASDPRVELHDPVRAIRDGQVYDGWVVGFRLPLTVGDGDMTVTIGLVDS